MEEFSEIFFHDVKFVVGALHVFGQFVNKFISRQIIRRLDNENILIIFFFI